MIILGIDPGLANTGWGVVASEGSRLVCRGYGCLTTDPAEDLPARLRALHDGISSLLRGHSPEQCAIESVYFSTNVRTAFATGQARGAALVACAAGGLEVGEYGPGEVKLAVTGTGAADKRQVAYMVRRILRLAEEPTPDHAADALALAVTHAHSGAARGSRPGRPSVGWAAAVERAQAREARGASGMDG